MSRIKSLIDIDNYEPSYYPLEPIMESEIDGPDRIDWTIAELQSALDELEVEKPYNYLTELEVASERLRTLINDIKVPF